MPTYNFNKFSKDVTMVVDFKLTRQFKIRSWIAARLVTLAAMILGCGIEIDK